MHPVGRRSKATEMEDLEMRITRMRRLTVRQRKAWDRTLDCREYRWISSLPSSFYHIKGLHTLIISYNELDSLSPGIRLLSTLTSINVAGNNLTELPHELGELPLRFLNVSNNKLTWLPASIIERHPDGNQWYRAQICPTLKANVPYLPSLFDMCCTALSANESLFHRVTNAPDYDALVPLQVRDYLRGSSLTGSSEDEGYSGRKACSHCGKVFYGKAYVERTYQRALNVYRMYKANILLVGMYCTLKCARVQLLSGKIYPV